MTEKIPGFPELDTETGIIFNRVVDKIKHVYSLYGYVPLDTRLVESVEVLNQKGIDSKELFSLGRISRGEDHERENKRQLALRFDLTVPMSRYIAENHRKMVFPFKRFQIAKVYRAESSKSSTGRFNEFYQCDIDIVGREKVDLAYDSEFPIVIYQIFTQIFNLKNFVIRISNRKLLEQLFKKNGLEDAAKMKRAVKVIDDIEKVPIEKTNERLQEIGMSTEQAKSVLDFFKEVYSCKPMDSLKVIERHGLDCSELSEVITGILAGGVPETHIKIDPRIARGLDYYTGTVYETNVLNHMELGSVCSGGRYDDLVGTLSGNRGDNFPGVGISIGLSRLIPILIQDGLLGKPTQTTTKILVACIDPEKVNEYQQIASQLRTREIPTEVYLDKDVPLKKQLTYANKKGIPHVLMYDDKKITFKNMKTGIEEDIDLELFLTNIELSDL